MTYEAAHHADTMGHSLWTQGQILARSLFQQRMENVRQIAAFFEGLRTVKGTRPVEENV